MKKNHAMTMRISEDALDDPRFPLGVIRLARDHTVTHMNRAINAMVGGQLQVGMSITSLSLDDKSRDAMTRALAERAQGAGTAYPISLKNEATGTIIRGSIAALPEYDEAGQVSGSIGFVRDETIDTAATAIYQDIERAKAPELLLGQLADQLKLVLKFDTLMVTLMGQDGKHLRLFYDSDPDGPQSSFRWWPMPPYVKKMLDEFDPLMDFSAFHKTHAKDDPDIAGFWQRGYRHPCQLEVVHRGARVALVSLWRKAGQKAFTAEEKDACERLPVREAVRFALALDTQRQQRFASIAVHRAMRKGRDAAAIGQSLVDDLCARFKWEHVSLFYYAEERGKLRLVCQARNNQLRLPDGYEQGVGVGLLGECVKSRRQVNSGDVLHREGYISAVNDARSELVMPLPGQKVRWLLNIESRMLNAFAREEERFLAGLLKFVASLLESAAGAELHSQIMDSVGDVILQTDGGNIVRDVSASCKALLGYTREQMIGRNIDAFVEVVDTKPAEEPNPWQESGTTVGTFDEQASSVLHSTGRTSQVARFKRGDKGRASMLVSVAPNEGLFGGKVFVASDLSSRQLVNRVDQVGGIIGELASEIRVPLALAAQLLKGNDAVKGNEGTTERDRLVRAQIEKADVSIESVVRAATGVDNLPLARGHFDIGNVVMSLHFALPERERGFLSIDMPKEQLLVHAAREPLKSCMNALLTYLLRCREKDEIVTIHAAPRGDREAVLDMGLRTRGGEPVMNFGFKKASEMVMIDAVVPTVMERMGGSFEPAGPHRVRHRLVVATQE